MNWIPGNIPEIPEGSMARFWVTLKNRETGKRWVAPMEYLNAYVMPLADECYDPGPCAKPHNPDEHGDFDEYEWTGWSSGACEFCECSWMWSSDTVDIIAYAPAPQPYEPPEGKDR